MSDRSSDHPSSVPECHLWHRTQKTLRAYEQHLDRHIADAAARGAKQDSDDDTESDSGNEEPTITPPTPPQKKRKRKSAKSKQERGERKTKKDKLNKPLIGGAEGPPVSSAPTTSENDPIQSNECDINKFRMEGVMAAMQMFGLQNHNPMHSADHQTFVPGVFLPPPMGSRFTGSSRDESTCIQHSPRGQKID